MTIVEMLKDYNARVSYGNRWLVANDSFSYMDCVFVVYEGKAYARNARVVCETNNEAIAVAALLNEEVDNV